MIKLYSKPKLVSDKDTLGLSKSDITFSKIPQIRRIISNQALCSYNSISKNNLSPVGQKQIPYQNLVLQSFDKPLNNQYTSIIAKVGQNVQLLKGYHIQLAQHLRISRDIMAAKATRLDKLQSGFMYMVAASNRLQQQYKQLNRGQK